MQYIGQLTPVSPHVSKIRQNTPVQAFCGLWLVFILPCALRAFSVRVVTCFFSPWRFYPPHVKMSRTYKSLWCPVVRITSSAVLIGVGSLMACTLSSYGCPVVRRLPKKYTTGVTLNKSMVSGSPEQSEQDCNRGLTFSRSVFNYQPVSVVWLTFYRLFCIRSESE